MLDLYSEPFMPTGSMDARSARRALGVTDMGFWEIFLRETVQNSWDARGDSSRIRFVVDAKKLNEEETLVLKNEVFAEVPPGVSMFAKSLSSSAPTMLVVADVGTRGLSGPLRADQVPGKDQRNDFCDFVRNVGRDATRELDGGTYGFGKSVLFNASEINTCVIYSQTLEHGEIESRLIVSRVDQQFTSDGKRFTGRHWWGNAASDGVLDPLLGKDARELAIKMGLDLLGEQETGTVLGIIAPVMSALDDSFELARLVERIQESALRWAWPHMVDLGGGPAIEFEFRVDGDLQESVSVESHPVLRHYASAYRRAIESQANQLTEDSWPTSTLAINSQRPRRYLGQLAYTKWLSAETEGWGAQHHVALMRRPHLVVKYLPIDADPLGQEIAGVFIAANEANDEFALSEPAAHDDWKPAVTPAVEGRRPSSPVKSALARIVEAFRTSPLASEAALGPDQSPGVSRVSRLLGDFLSGLSGGAEAQPASRGGARQGVALSRVRVIGTPWLSVQDGKTVSHFAFELVGIESGTLRAEPHVVLDRGLERVEDRPIGAESPVVLGWYHDDALVCAGPLWTVGEGAATSVRVTQPSRSALTLAIKVEN